MEIKLALKVNDKDNVATIFANGITDGSLRAHFRETVSPGRTPDLLSDFRVFPDCDRTLESNPKGPSANWAENAEAV